MATTTRFYPRGYIGTEQGILRIAKVRDPGHWLPEKIYPDEGQIWGGLGLTHNAEFLSNHLSVLVPIEQRKNDTSMIDRLYDFEDALVELRKALHSGDVVAEFLDESGKPDFILKDGWGGDAGDEILRRGIAYLADGWSRLVLLRIDTLDELAKSLPPTCSDQNSGSSQNEIRPTQTGKLAASEKRRIFSEWRDSIAPRIPTIQEDIRQMKALGINRDDTRELRKEHPSLPRGKPSQNNGSKKAI